MEIGHVACERVERRAASQDGHGRRHVARIFVGTRPEPDSQTARPYRRRDRTMGAPSCGLQQLNWTVVPAGGSTRVRDGRLLLLVDSVPAV